LRKAVSLITVFAALCSTAVQSAEQKPKQLVVVSFDGAGDNAMWARSRDIASRHGAHFTYFLSCTNLIDRPSAATYKAPGRKAGRSNVGFAPTVEDVRARLDHVWKAHSEGHEIASHGCGHFDGGEWTREQWLTEMQSFDRVLKEAWRTAGIPDREPSEWQDFVAHDIIGFRAPYLSTSPALIAAEKAHGYIYDASPVASKPEWPGRNGSVYTFGLPLIPEGPKARNIVAMDYNLFVRHSMGVDNPSRSAEFEERAYKAFRAAFDREHDGDRNPLQIGLHFPLMNDGAYWRAMERLVGEVCTLPDVGCVTYGDVITQMQRETKQTAGPSL